MQEDLNIKINTENRNHYSLPEIHRGILDADRMVQKGWVFRNLHLVAIPLHSVWDRERVEYYKKQMKNNNNKKETSKVLILIQKI